jgi:hypothetical protein
MPTVGIEEPPGTEQQTLLLRKCKLEMILTDLACTGLYLAKLI